MTKIYAIANQKGGVGKTTTCVNLAASLVATKKRVLLVDLDPQGNATMGSGVNKNEIEENIYDVLTERASIKDCIVVSESGKYHVLPANGDLTAAEVEMLALGNKERRLQNALNQVRDQYDYILIDCPPSLNMLTLNALAACDGVIIAMQCEYYALEDDERERVFWRLDYYDRAMRFASEDAADPAVTRRVLTIMLSDEY